MRAKRNSNGSQNIAQRWTSLGTAYLWELCIKLNDSNEPKAQALIASLRKYSETWYLASKWAQVGCVGMLMLLLLEKRARKPEFIARLPDTYLTIEGRG